MLKYVFFDLGLTLAENKMPERMLTAMQRSGMEVSLREAEESYHLANKHFMREHQGKLGRGNRESMCAFMRYACQVIGEEDKADTMIGHLEQMGKPKWCAFDYSISTLKTLKDRGMKLGLISNWDTGCRKVLEENHLAELLDIIVVSSEEGVEKPDAEIFERALKRAGIQASECIYVGDNYYDDGIGAEKLGIPYYIVNPNGYFGIEELKEKHVPVIQDIRALPEQLNVG